MARQPGHCNNKSLTTLRRLVRRWIRRRTCGLPIWGRRPYKRRVQKQCLKMGDLKIRRRALHLLKSLTPGICKGRLQIAHLEPVRAPLLFPFAQSLRKSKARRAPLIPWPNSRPFNRQRRTDRPLQRILALYAAANILLQLRRTLNSFHVSTRFALSASRASPDPTALPAKSRLLQRKICQTTFWLLTRSKGQP